MTIFAVDSATGAGSASVWKDGVILAESYADVGLTHSETLMELCDEVFRRAALTPKDIDCFAVTSGPGSFTGLRIGIGVIKGMAFAAQKPCVAVPTLEALAYNAQGFGRIAAPVINARRGRVYLGAYAVQTDVQKLRDDAVVPVVQLPELFQGQAIILIGDAARLCYNELREQMDCIAAPTQSLMPRAAAVACAAANYIQQGRTVPALELEPEYMLIPQAERERQEKGNGI